MKFFNMTYTEVKMRKKYADTYILIDTDSTCSVFRNPNILLDIKPSKHTMRIVRNGGYHDSRMRGLFPEFFRL